MPPRPVEIGKIDERRDEIRVETQGGAVFVFGLRQFPPPQIQYPEVEVGLWPVGIDLFRGDELIGGFDQGGLLVWRQRQQVGAGQCSRRLDAHGATRVAE
jgi:hypothetical protein